MDNLLLVIAALLLVLLNGFFVAAEFGLVKLRQTRIRSIAKTSGLRGRLLVEVHQHLDTYLSACQLGITLASLGLGWIGGTHLGPANETQQDATLVQLVDFQPAFVAANHCTGFRMMARLQAAFGERFIPAFVGTEIVFETD